MKRFTFYNPGKLMFGEGLVAKSVGKELSALGAKRPLLVTDSMLSGSAMVATVRTALGQSLVAEFSGVVPDTGVEIVLEALQLARREQADSVVSVGGGSSIDTAKVVAALLGSGAASVWDIVGLNRLAQSPVPHVAIPTTAGTGSECTQFALVKDREAHKKLAIGDRKLIPPVGMLDPTFTVSMSKSVTASTGMDAFTHAAEAVMSTYAMAPCDALAFHAIGTIARFLPRAVENGDDLEARGMLLIASAEAGMAAHNALAGIVHAMSHAVGGLIGVPHGLANAILLPAGMAYNAEVAPERVALIGAAMGLMRTGRAKEDAALAVRAIGELVQRVGIPAGLRHAGVETGSLGEVAVLAMADPALTTNPRQPASASEIEELLKTRY